MSHQDALNSLWGLKTMRVLIIGWFSLVGSVLSLSPAHGAEMIFFRTREAEVQLSKQDFETLAETGVLPTEIQEMMGSGLLAPQVFQTLVSEPIRLSASVDQFLESATGEFILGQLATLIDSPPAQDADPAKLIRSAFVRAADNQQLSFIELIRQYPEKEVRVDLTGLERTYKQVLRFAEKVQSDADGTRQILSELLCNCEPPSTAMLPLSDGSYHHIPCLQSQGQSLSSPQIQPAPQQSSITTSNITGLKTREERKVDHE